jgi:hypothetical protein
MNLVVVVVRERQIMALLPGYFQKYHQAKNYSINFTGFKLHLSQSF